MRWRGISHYPRGFCLCRIDKHAFSHAKPACSFLRILVYLPSMSYTNKGGDNSLLDKKISTGYLLLWHMQHFCYTATRHAGKPLSVFSKAAFKEGQKPAGQDGSSSSHLASWEHPHHCTSSCCTDQTGTLTLSNSQFTHKNSKTLNNLYSPQNSVYCLVTGYCTPALLEIIFHHSLLHKWPTVKLEGSPEPDVCSGCLRKSSIKHCVLETLSLLAEDCLRVLQEQLHSA